MRFKFQVQQDSVSSYLIYINPQSIVFSKRFLLLSLSCTAGDERSNGGWGENGAVYQTGPEGSRYQVHIRSRRTSVDTR